MKRDVDFDVVHTGSLLDQPVMKIDTYASVLEDDFEDKHYVPTGVDYTDEQLAALSKNSGNEIERFELTRAGRKVKKLTISSELSGVQVEFEDEAQKVAGASSVEARPGKKQPRSITFHDDELVTESKIGVLEITNERICAGAGVDPFKGIAYIALKTNFGQIYGEASLASIGLRKWGRNYLDTEKGSLIGVYGIAGPDGLLSLGFILAPAQDVVEYRFLNMQYDLDAFQCVGDRMVSYKGSDIINNSNAIVDSQVKFAHT